MPDCWGRSARNSRADPPRLTTSVSAVTKLANTACGGFCCAPLSFARIIPAVREGFASLRSPDAVCARDVPRRLVTRFSRVVSEPAPARRSPRLCNLGLLKGSAALRPCPSESQAVPLLPLVRGLPKRPYSRTDLSRFGANVSPSRFLARLPRDHRGPPPVGDQRGMWRPSGSIMASGWSTFGRCNATLSPKKRHTPN